MKTFKRFFREDLLIFLFLLLLFASLTALSLFLLYGEKRRTDLLIEYEAEKIATALMESFQGNRGLEIEPLREKVLGFGVYSGSGAALQRFGSAPSFLTILEEAPPEPSFRFSRGDKSLTLVRRIGLVPGMRGLHRGMQRMMGRFPGAPQLLFIELSVKDYWASERLFRSAQVLAPVFIFGLVVLIGLLYRRNSDYRKRLAAREQLARLGEITRTLSHEIKNPLSAIRIQTAILKRTLPEARRNDLRIIEEEVQRLSLLTDRIGDFLRDPLGDPQVIELDRFLRDLALRFDSRVQYMGAAGQPLRVHFDSQRLRSVMENLINNALESMEGEGDGTAAQFGGKVEVVCAAHHNRVEVSVLDRGSGIAAEIQDKIFDPFFTSKTKGSGIGLAITKRFVEAAGGTLSLSNRRGGGTEARIALQRESP